MMDLYQARAELARGVAHPARLQIIDLLSQRSPQNVGELTESLGMAQSTVSKHLSVLKSVGVLASEKDGLQVNYSLRTPCIATLFSCLDNVLREDLRQRQLTTAGVGDHHDR